jgi:hypothetical protein
MARQQTHHTPPAIGSFSNQYRRWFPTILGRAGLAIPAQYGFAQGFGLAE